MYDVLIKNGVVIDGTGKTKFMADVGIKDDKIAKIGELHDERGEIEINASGKYICPGFIDVNNHSDTYWQMCSHPELKSLITQGVTTIIGGNCGSSLAPLAQAQTIETIQKWANIKEVSVNWLDFEEFFDFIEKKKLSVNFATLVGHATLRRGILKDEMRTLASEELAFVKKMLKDSMKEGALGLSTGLVYTHSRSANLEELTELAQIVKKYDGIFVSHIRDEGKGLVESLNEIIKVGQNSGVRIHISHLKAVGKKNWHLMDEALFLINKARKSGVEITFDVYPYTNIGSVLYTLLPQWVSAGGNQIMLKRLKDPVIRAKAAKEMRNSDVDYSKMEIAISSLSKTLPRRRLADIAQAQGKTLENAIIDVLVASEGRVIISSESLSEENVKKGIVHPLSIISTNGSGYSQENKQTGEIVHPRCFGTFPKFLAKYVRDGKKMEWEKAIEKITALPAEKFRLKKRGRIQENYFADITVLDPKNIKDLATAENPYQYSQGIEQVVVNGELALDGGKILSRGSGKIITRK